MGLLDFMGESEDQKRRREQATLASLIAKEISYETRKSEKAAQRESDRQDFQDHVQDLRLEAGRVQDLRLEAGRVQDLRLEATRVDEDVKGKYAKMASVKTADEPWHYDTATWVKRFKKYGLVLSNDIFIKIGVPLRENNSVMEVHFNFGYLDFSMVSSRYDALKLKELGYLPADRLIVSAFDIFEGSSFFEIYGGTQLDSEASLYFESMQTVHNVRRVDLKSLTVRNFYVTEAWDRGRVDPLYQCEA